MKNMKRINNSTFLDEDTGIVKVIIDNVEYKTCAMLDCQRFFKTTGSNHKYCDKCRKKANIQNTIERRKKNKLCAKLEISE